MNKNILYSTLCILLICTVLTACTPAAPSPTAISLPPTQAPAAVPTATPEAKQPAATNEPTDNPTAYLGGWVVNRYEPGTVTAMTTSDAAAWIGRSVVLNPDLVFFDQFMCLKPAYQVSTTNLADYLNGFKTTPDNLKIMDGDVTLVQTACADNPMKEFVMLDDQTMMINSDGAFFFLEPETDLGDGGLVMKPVIQVQSSEKPKFTTTIVRPLTSDDGFNDAVAAAIQAELDTFVETENDQQPPDELKDKSAEFDVNYQVEKDDNGFVSVLFTEFTYIVGAAHPNTYFFVVNYDLKSGSVVMLSDLFAPGSDYLNRLSQAATKQLTDKGVQIFPEGLSPLDENFVDWTIQGQNLVLNFEAEQVASHAEGAQKAIVPLADLQDILKFEIK